MTCAKCGMSIDSNAGERQQSVRGRVKEKPEIEIDDSLPFKPSTFPLALAISIAVLVIGGAVFVMYGLRSQRASITDAQKQNLKMVEQMQKAIGQVWDASLAAHDAPSCRMLVEIVRKPCLPTVDPALLAIDEVVVALARSDTSKTCVSAVETYSKSRFTAKCD